MNPRPHPPDETASPFLRDLNLLLTRTCNATCGHCSVESSPHDRRAMSDPVFDRVLLLVEAFSRRPGAQRVVVTGGEPFLERERLERVAKAARAAGLRVGVETNAVWASTPRQAARCVQRIPIDDYLISASLFHARFVPPARVLHAWRAASDQGRAALVRIAHQEPPTAEETDLLARIGGVVPAEKIERVAISPMGRALQTGLGRNRPPRTRPPDDRCPADGPMVDHAGRVHPCCNEISTLEEHPLILGNVLSDPASEILDRLEESPVFHFLRRRGTGALFDLLPAAGREAAGPGRFSDSVCQSCAVLLGDPALRQAVAALRPGAVPRLTPPDPPP